MKYSYLFFLFILFLTFIFGFLYEDEIGKKDW